MIASTGSKRPHKHRYEQARLVWTRGFRATVDSRLMGSDVERNIVRGIADYFLSRNIVGESLK